MKARVIDPRRLDMGRFAHEAGVLEGQWPLASMPRLTDSVSHAPDAPLTWSARGELREVRGEAPQVWLHLEGRAAVEMQCQRCLGPVGHELVVASRFRFEPDESAAAKLDAEIEDDVLAFTHELDLHDLFEDELLLALPLVPRHDDCRLPQSSADTVMPAAEPRNPFAALATLRKPPVD